MEKVRNYHIYESSHFETRGALSHHLIEAQSDEDLEADRADEGSPLLGEERLQVRPGVHRRRRAGPAPACRL